MPYGIIHCYLPPGRGGVPALTPAEAGTRFGDPGGMQGWVDLGTDSVLYWYLVGGKLGEQTASHAAEVRVSFHGVDDLVVVLLYVSDTLLSQILEESERHTRHHWVGQARRHHIHHFSRYQLHTFTATTQKKIQQCKLNLNLIFTFKKTLRKNCNLTAVNGCYLTKFVYEISIKIAKSLLCYKNS